jgi:hypothetical protein
VARRREAEEANGYAQLIWFDPGGTTGWSVFSVHPDALSQEDLSVLENVVWWDQGQFVGDEDNQADEMVELCRVWPHAAIGIESFILRTRRSSEDTLSPVRLIAKLGYALRKGHEGRGSDLKCGRGKPRRLFQQQPSLAKNTVTDDRLKEWGYYRREGGEEHARDATRHALTFLRRTSDEDPRSTALRVAAWPHLFGVED